MTTETLSPIEAQALQSLATVIQPITLSQLNDLLPPHKDEAIDGVGIFRLHRLSAIDVMEFQSMIADITDDAGTADKLQYIRAAMNFVAKSLGGEFATEAGKDSLLKLPFEVQTKLISAAMDASRANIGKRVSQIEAAKNE